MGSQIIHDYYSLVKKYYIFVGLFISSFANVFSLIILGFAELAYNIISKYPFLVNCKNCKEETPLHLLAMSPTTFRSGYHLEPMDSLLFHRKNYILPPPYLSLVYIYPYLKIK